MTAELPQPPAPSGPADETAVLPQVPSVPPGAADETAVLPPVSVDETAELPSVAPGAADETAVLPPVRSDAPTDRVPPGFFRDERPAPDPDGSEPRTREMPRIDADGTTRGRPRSDWAEETPWTTCPHSPTSCWARTTRASTATSPAARNRAARAAAAAGAAEADRRVPSGREGGSGPGCPGADAEGHRCSRMAGPGARGHR